MTIIGLEIRAINEASSGNITRTGGTGIINGLTVGESVTTENISSTDFDDTLIIIRQLTIVKDFYYGPILLHGNVEWFLQMMAQRKFIFKAYQGILQFAKLSYL